MTITERRPFVPESQPATNPESNGHCPQLASLIRPIEQSPLRRPVVIAGRVTATWQRSWAGCPALECRLDDGTGAVTLVFLGRPRIAGIDSGRHLIADGTLGYHRGRVLMLNPFVTLVDAACTASEPDR